MLVFGQPVYVYDLLQSEPVLHASGLAALFERFESTFAGSRGAAMFAFVEQYGPTHFSLADLSAAVQQCSGGKLLLAAAAVEPSLYREVPNDGASAGSAAGADADVCGENFVDRRLRVHERRRLWIDSFLDVFYVVHTDSCNLGFAPPCSHLLDFLAKHGADNDEFSDCAKRFGCVRWLVGSPYEARIICIGD